MHARWIPSSGHGACLDVRDERMCIQRLMMLLREEVDDSGREGEGAAFAQQDRRYPAAPLSLPYSLTGD